MIHYVIFPSLELEVLFFHFEFHEHTRFFYFTDTQRWFVKCINVSPFRNMASFWVFWNSIELTSLKLTAKEPDNGWLEDDRFLLGPGLFSCATVDGSNPAPPGIYKTLYYLSTGERRISSINSMLVSGSVWSSCFA